MRHVREIRKVAAVAAAAVVAVVADIEVDASLFPLPILRTGVS